MARQKNNTMQNGGREALSFHATPAQRNMRMGQTTALSGAAAAASATCTAAGAMEQSGPRGRPRKPWGMGCAAGAAGGDTKNAARPGMNPAGGNMKGGGILLSRIAAQYHRRNRA